MLQGPYGFNPIKFWAIFRPITIVLFVIAIAVNWKAVPMRRKLLVIAFLLDMATTLATFTYFAPETEVITQIPFSIGNVDEQITAKARLWERMNFIRLAAFYAGSILLLFAINKKSKGSTTDHIPA